MIALPRNEGEPAEPYDAVARRRDDALRRALNTPPKPRPSAEESSAATPLVIAPNTARLVAVMEDVRSVLGPGQAIYDFIGPQELFTAEYRHEVSAATHKLVVVFEPSERLKSLQIALRAK